MARRTTTRSPIRRSTKRVLRESLTDLIICNSLERKYINHMRGNKIGPGKGIITVSQPNLQQIMASVITIEMHVHADGPISFEIPDR